MTRCIVHIGMHRTGSTSIQESLRGLNDRRFLYAELGDNPNHSLAMYSLFSAEPELHHIHRSNGANASTISKYIAEMRDDLAQAVIAAEGRTLIISGEDISALRRDALIRLRDDFEERFDDVIIVGYVRSPMALMTSSFQHRVSLGLVDRFDPGRQYRSYQGTFGIFDEVFGRDRVNLWKFDVESFPERCAVRDLCARLGIELPEERIVRLNESLPRHVVSLLYTYFKVGANGTPFITGAERKKLLDSLTPLGNDRFRISAEVLAPILEKQRPDICWMEARLGQSLREEIDKHRPEDVREELDLLRIDPKVVRNVLEILGDAAPKGVKGETSEEIARLVQALTEAQAEQRTTIGLLNSFVGNRVAALLQYIFR